ncbi:hypothetical protein K9N50_08950 [bacterium]|nr:hypothetical protein [bacterium]
MALPNSSICHTELYARNLEESAKFYGDLFGWTTSELDESYLSWEDPAKNSGGFTTSGAPITNPSATFYIKVNNISDMLENIKAHGGAIIRLKTEIGGGQAFMHCSAIRQATT